MFFTILLFIGSLLLSAPMIYWIILFARRKRHRPDRDNLRNSAFVFSVGFLLFCVGAKFAPTPEQPEIAQETPSAPSSAISSRALPDTLPTPTDAATAIPAATERPATASPESTTEPMPAPTLSPSPETAQPMPTPLPTVAATPQTTPALAGNPTPRPDTTYNFDTYNNPDQQETSDRYVLNTKTMKIHSPGCKSVAKIAPENFATSNKSLAELEAEGYTRCDQKDESWG